MRRIIPDCRNKLTDVDIAFITSVLTRSAPASRAQQSDFLVNLLTDPASRDSILDDPELYHAVLEHPGQLHISLHFYFYILLRKSLLEAGLDNRELADYIAALLSDWAQSTHFNSQIKAEGRAHYAYASDLWTLMASADERARYDILVYMGNHYLFMTGLFPDHIRHLARRTGGPRLRFYEAHGRKGFKLAADHRLAIKHNMDEIYQLLAESFTVIRHTLNDISARQTFIAG